MRTLSLIVRSAILLTIICFAPSIAVAQTYSGPKCLGPFCVDRKLPMAEMYKRVGVSKHNPDYYIAKNKSQLLVVHSDEHFVQGVAIRAPSYVNPSDEKYCTPTDENIDNWRTAEKIGLGSSEEEVRAAYGKPSGGAVMFSDSRSATIETRKLFYKGRVGNVAQAAVFDIRDGKVSAIDLQSETFLGPDCLGPWCAPSILLRAFMAQVGPNSKRSPQSDKYCYQSQDSTAFLVARVGDEVPKEVDTVLLADFPACSPSVTQTTDNDLHAWTTPEGIHLGSSEDEVLNAYGPPDKKEKLGPNTCCDSIVSHRWPAGKAPDLGDKTFSYASSELERAEFGFRKSKVSYIFVSNSE